jgi:1-deoxy-D-xylulose-5-phosphate reductoisomerase
MDGVKTVSILGATGSVGRSTVDLLLSAPEKFSVQTVTCHSNTALLAEQAVKLNAKLAVAADLSAYKDLKEKLSSTSIEVAAGPEAMLEAAARPAAWTMAAIVGVAGLPVIMKAVEQGRCVAIANKEPLVAAGPFVMKAAKKSGAVLLPVDSEHNAVFQVFDHAHPDGIERIILTASGGPFLNRAAHELNDITPEQAVAHPNWSMGAKISVDSATMMNKALEVIEAHYLFAMPPEKIEVLIHPQSVVHSMVEYKDGSVLAQMGAPDMRTPIAHALAWPQRMATTGQKLNFTKARRMDFQPLDPARFPAVPLAYECINAGPWACVTMNAANELMVDAFLKRRTAFNSIVDSVRTMVEQSNEKRFASVNDIIEYDRAVRERTESYIMDRMRKKAAGS